MQQQIIYALFCAAILTACKNNKQDSTKEDKTINNETHVSITDEQFKTIGLELGNVEQKNLHSVVKASGYLAVLPQNKASVSTFLGAVIKSISVAEGVYVKQGQTLALLEHPDFITLQQSYLTEKNNFSYLEKDYQRQKELAEQNAGTLKIFQQAERDYNSSKAKLSALETQLKMLAVNLNELSKGNIIPIIALASPIDGYIGHITINIGEFVQPNKLLFEIIDNSKIHVDLLVYEKDLFKIKIGQKVNFILANQPEHQEEHNNETIKGEIYGINKSFELNTKALTVHAKIENEKHELIPGMYVNALIDVGQQTSQTVPVDAVVKANGKDWIFVLDESEIKNGSYNFKRIEVLTGVSDLGYIEISPAEKISSTAKVVVKNPFFILSKMKEGEHVEE